MRRTVLTTIFALASLSVEVANAQTPVNAERRVVVTLDRSDSNFAVNGMSRRRMSLRMEHAAVVHGLRIDLVDAAGAVVTEGVMWNVTVWSAANGGNAIATLTEARPELRVPRPYGLRVEAIDSLTVEMDVQALGAGGSTLRAIVDYELPDAGSSRLPVLALTSSRAVPVNGGSEDAWTWQPTVQGRLVAVSSEALARADEIVLEDAQTGAVLWRTRTHRALAGIGGRQAQEQIRPGITLEEGREYRLRTIYAANTAPSSAQRAVAPLAVIMPSAGGNR